MPWDWITDETRSLTRFRTAATVADYVTEAVDSASIDRWGGAPAPLILCESRSLAGTLDALAARYACPIASTNGQARGFLISKVAPSLRPNQRVLYLGDFDWCGRQIEAHSRRTLEQHAFGGARSTVLPRQWERIALTEQQVREHDLPVISKPDRRYRPTRSLTRWKLKRWGRPASSTRCATRLDELMPEPLDDVLERQALQRDQVAEQLRGMN